jgi:hypothetical protein
MQPSNFWPQLGSQLYRGERGLPPEEMSGWTGSGRIYGHCTSVTSRRLCAVLSRLACCRRGARCIRPNAVRRQWSAAYVARRPTHPFISESEQNAISELHLHDRKGPESGNKLSPPATWLAVSSHVYMCVILQLTNVRFYVLQESSLLSSRWSWNPSRCRVSVFSAVRRR